MEGYLAESLFVSRKTLHQAITFKTSSKTIPEFSQSPNYVQQHCLLGKPCLVLYLFPCFVIFLDFFVDT